MVSEIIRLKNGNYLIVSEDLSSMSLAQEVWGFTSLAVYSPSANSIINVQKLGFFYNEWTLVENYPYDATCSIETNESRLTLEMRENYYVEGFEDENTYYITRYFEFNESRNLFVENRQEKIVSLK